MRGDAGAGGRGGATAADLEAAGFEEEALGVGVEEHVEDAFAQVEGRSLGDLADVLSVSAPTMSKTISTLEARKWVARQKSETDGRVVMVGLTPEGRSTLHKAEEYMVRRIAEALDALSDEERARLSSGLEILGDVFSRVPSGTESARTP